MFSVSAIASALLLVPGAFGQQQCDSIYNAIQSHNQLMANANPSQSISTFTALLAALGLDNSRISQLGSSSVLIPNDQAFATFVEEAAGPNADPVSFIMKQPDVFKQILLFHFTGPLMGSEGELHTAIERVVFDQVPQALQGWIDTSAICGRADSSFIHIKYTSDSDDMAYKFTEPVSQHFTSNELDRICDTPSVSAVIVDRVLTPCPLSMMFSSCMTIAAAAAEIPNHPFGTTPYKVAYDASIVSRLKHPNVLASSSGASYTVFMPTAAALADAGVTAPEFTATPGALDHVVKGHIVAEELCIGAATAPTNGQLATKLDGIDEFCGGGGSVTVATGPQGGITVTAASGASASVSAGTKNIAVCGGVVHVVNGVLLPCEAAAYSVPATPETPVDTPADGAEAAAQETGSAGAGEVAPVDSAVGVATGVIAAAVTLAAALAM